MQYRRNAAITRKVHIPKLTRHHADEENPLAELICSDPNFRVVCGRGENSLPTLSLLMKRRYPLITDSPSSALAGQALRILPSDECAWKPGSQIIVSGNACPPYNSKVSKLMVEISAHQISHKIQVWGARKILTKGTHIHFSEPKPIQQVPMNLGYSFGGESQGFSFPPNPIGLGFHLRSRRRELQNQPLPHLEDPSQPLLPEHIGLDGWKFWTNLPRPMHTGFVPSQFFPRSRWLRGMHSQPRLLFSAHPNLCRERPFAPAECITLKHCLANTPLLDIPLPDQHPSAWLQIDSTSQTSQFMIQDIHIHLQELCYTILWRANFLEFIDKEYLQFGIIPPGES